MTSKENLNDWITLFDKYWDYRNIRCPKCKFKNMEFNEMVEDNRIFITAFCNNCKSFQSAHRLIQNSDND